MPVIKYAQGSDQIDRIVREIKRHEEGIWLYQLSRNVGIPAATLHYIVFGRRVKNNVYGGLLRNKIESIREGRNRKIRWRG